MSYAAGDPPYHASEPMAPMCGPSILTIIVTSCFSLLLWLVIAFQLLFIVPKTEKIFLEFKMKLPLVTEWVMRDAWWVAIFCFIITLPFCIVPRTRWAGLVLLIVLPFLLNLVMIAGIYFPYAELVNGLAGGPKQ